MKAVIWSMSLVGLFTSSVQAFDYVDNKGFRHWNHYGDHRAKASKEVVQSPGKPSVEIVQDTVRFLPIDDAAKDGMATELSARE
jgi:hypothetical protein